MRALARSGRGDPGRSRTARLRHRPGEQASPGREEDDGGSDHSRLTPESAARWFCWRRGSCNDTGHGCVRRGDEQRGRFVAEGGQQRVPVGRPLCRVLAECGFRECGEARRRIGLQVRDGGWLRVAVHVEQRERLVGGERQRSRQHPEEDHAERIDVACRPDRLGGGLFRREVRSRAQHRPGLGQCARARHAAGEPEVAELRPFFLVEEDVRRLQVTVDEPSVVELREACRNAVRHALRLRERQRALLQAILERPARQPFERQERAGFVLAVVVDPHHVLVREGCERLPLAPEAAQVGGRRQDLERNRPVERLVVRAPDLRHRTVAL